MCIYIQYILNPDRTQSTSAISLLQEQNFWKCNWKKMEWTEMFSRPRSCIKHNITLRTHQRYDTCSHCAEYSDHFQEKAKTHETWARGCEKKTGWSHITYLSLRFHPTNSATWRNHLGFYLRFHTLFGNRDVNPPYEPSEDERRGQGH